MVQDLFYVELAKADKTSIYAFTRSETGILDFAGDVPNDYEGDASKKYNNPEKMQRIDSSLYFSPSWYTYLSRNLTANISVYIPKNIKNLDTNQYSFLVHIGAILLAIQEKDSLLVAELINRRSSVFGEFLPIMQHILKPIAAEALFAWVYGSFKGAGKFAQIYSSEEPVKTGETDTAAILFSAAKDALKPNPDSETPEKMFARFFAQEIPFDFTIGIVGASNHPWVGNLEAVEGIANNAAIFNFTSKKPSVGTKFQDLFEGLSASVQAEPYNPHDPNAISVSIDDPLAKLKGQPSKSKVGYIRATGASILRKARPNQFTYNATLKRIGGTPTWPDNAIVIQIKF